MTIDLTRPGTASVSEALQSLSDLTSKVEILDPFGEPVYTLLTFCGNDFEMIFGGPFRKVLEDLPRDWTVRKTDVYPDENIDEVRLRQARIYSEQSDEALAKAAEALAKAEEQVKTLRAAAERDRAAYNLLRGGTAEF